MTHHVGQRPHEDSKLAVESAQPAKRVYDLFAGFHERQAVLATDHPGQGRERRQLCA